MKTQNFSQNDGDRFFNSGLNFYSIIYTMTGLPFCRRSCLVILVFSKIFKFAFQISKSPRPSHWWQIYCFLVPAFHVNSVYHKGMFVELGWKGKCIVETFGTVLLLCQIVTQSDGHNQTSIVLDPPILRLNVRLFLVTYNKYGKCPNLQMNYF